ncbi:Cellular nucleic acid-binding protein [Carex littledalei]|uniref:Cellular nucleic acid-binding protein n=1 Tax=Carex littledalei TaxID=544730 RepID=A0A833VC62_9POAL|nr:Cellular nucleic acid-binding protein [Carex littledalei]
MASLEARQANNKAILLAIQRREANTATTIKKLTYAQIVRPRHPPPQTQHTDLTPNHNAAPPKQSALTQPPPKYQPTPNHLIDGATQPPAQPTSQRLETTDNNNSREEGWTLVTRKKHKTLHKDNTRPKSTSIERDHTWLLQQRRCFKCFLKGHQKKQCRRAVKCLQCNREGHISKHCLSHINGRKPPTRELKRPEAPSAKGEKPSQFMPLSAGTKQGPSTNIQQHHTWLLKQGRCLKCCLRGHTKQQCTRPTKCFHCNKEGHMSRQCKLRLINDKPPTSAATPIKTTAEQPTQAHQENRANHLHNNHLKHMENTPAWETMDLMDPDDFEDGRRESLRVFLPPRSQLRPINSFLERSALVLAGPHQINRYVAHRLAVTLANYFNMQPRDFPISRVHQNYGDFIVRFPNVNLRDQAVAICAFTLGPNMHLQLVRWSPGMGGVYDPSTHKARLRLYGLPNHNWNIHDLDILVSGFGHLLRVEPFYSTGNHQEIRILVGCFHPINIPRTVDLSEEPNSTIVHIVIEGWMHDGTAAIPRDVNNMNEGQDPFGGPTDGQHRQRNTRQQPTPQRRPNNTGSNSPDSGNHGRNGGGQGRQPAQLESLLNFSERQ